MCKKLYLNKSVKYLDVKIDCKNCENRANYYLLFKMRKYVSLKILRSIYFATTAV